jgi:signal peptidase I
MVGRAIAVAALVPLWFAFLAPRPLGGPLSLIWVSGFSMEPTLRTGDVAVLHERTDYQVGDIVAFDIPEGGTVIHRVIDVTPDGYRFQGDNRDTPDPWTLDRAAIRGRQVFALRGVADGAARLRRPEIMGALVAALVFVGGLPTARRAR